MRACQRPRKWLWGAILLLPSVLGMTACYGSQQRRADALSNLRE